ncbi:MAG TPA: ABC transporter permease [Vicinamibacterales bacterium]|nr:ABC transporter permease [Vicinamibacterales bacterium]
MTRTRDWRREILARAAAAGIDLPEATVEEIAEHLNEIRAAARREGRTEEEAQARAQAALEESTIDVLRSHASRSRGVPHAPDDAAAIGAPDGKALNVGGAIRLAVRQLRLRPGFAAVTILVLALGIGASVTVFSIVDSVLLRPLPYREPDRLVTLWDTNASTGLKHETMSPVTFMDYHALPEFEGAAAWWRPSLNLVDPGLDPVRVNAIEVSGNFFDVLGVRPQIGGGFPVGGAFFVQREPIVVISDRLWRSRYSADPSIVGRQIRFSGVPHTVAGVMPPGFNYPKDIEVWQRLNWDLTQHTRAAHFMETVLRLAPGVTLPQAVAASQTLGRRLEEEFAFNKNWSPKLVPLLEEQLGYYRPALFVLVGAVGLVLIIGCLNVASLLLTRALSREREIAVRVAIGASPRQLVVQLLSESFVLSSAGAALGLIAAAVALPVLVNLAPEGIPRLADAHIDLRALALVVALVGLTTVMFGLTPAFLLLRGKGSVDLRTGERGSSRATRRAYSVLVAGQVALACTLLVSSALLIRTVGNMMSTPTGVDADGVVTTSVQLANTAFPKWRAVADTHAALLDLIRRQPGIRAAGGGNVLPFEVSWRMPYLVEGQQTPTRPEDRQIAQFHTVTDGYFESMRAVLVAGRSFSTFDTADAAGVVVVNEMFARRHFPQGQPALGQIVSTTIGRVGPLGVNLMVAPTPPGQTPAQPARFEIVGIVRDIRNAPLGQAVEPAVFFSGQQFPFRELFLTIRAANTGAAVAAVRAALAAVTPNVPLGAVRTWGDRMAARTAEPRLLMLLLVFFGAAAGLLASLGVYGLLSWSVAQRTRELAIRLTLGARPASVGASVVRQSLVLIGIGLLVGLAIIRVAEGALARVLFEVSPRDPSSLAGASVLLTIVALAACLPPVLRALRVDPVDGLRAE